MRKDHVVNSAQIIYPLRQSLDFVVFLLLLSLPLPALLSAETSAAIERLPYTWLEEISPPMPLDIYAQAKLGNTSLIWYKDMKPGYYTLRLKCATDIWRRDFIVRLDHREIAFHTGYFTSSGLAEPPTYRFNFIVSQPGLHLIEIDCLTNTSPIHERALKLLEIAIDRRPSQSWPDLYDTTHQAQSFQHLWGWQPGSSYQRRQNWVLTGDYWKKRVVDESAKWGSNFIQLFPDAHKGYLKDIDITQAIRYAHEMGFVVDEHGHQGALDGKDLQDRYEKLENHLSEYLDRLQIPVFDSLDSWESEQYNIDKTIRLGTKENVIKTNHITWSYHPGATIADCKGAAGDCRIDLPWRYLHCLHEGFHGTNYAKVLMCAAGYTLCGYDDMDALSLFPNNLGYKNEYNWVFRTCQANARPYSTNMFGGSSSVDWIVKQNADFFRPNAYALQKGRVPINTAIAWLSETNIVLPEDMREWVYASGLNPCRSALVYQLATTGRDGQQAWRRQLMKHCGGNVVVPYRPRNWDPSSTVRLHNGILATDHLAFGDQCQLVWDSENLGQFDLNAKTVELARSFFKTRIGHPSKPVEKHTFTTGSAHSQSWNVKVPVGTYEIRVNTTSAKPFLAEVYLMGQYIGNVAGGTNGTSDRFACYVSDENTCLIELKLTKGEKMPTVTMALVPTNYKVPLVGNIGLLNDSSAELAASVQMSKSPNLPKRFSYSLTDSSTGVFPRSLVSDSNLLPRAIDLYFDGEIGNYLLTVRAKAPSPTQLEVSLNSHR